jgi:RNA recognition motif-containing protein
MEVLSCSVWVARKPPGFAFIEFDDRRDAMDAIRDLDGMFLLHSTCGKIFLEVLSGTVLP